MRRSVKNKAAFNTNTNTNAVPLSLHQAYPRQQNSDYAPGSCACQAIQQQIACEFIDTQQQHQQRQHERDTTRSPGRGVGQRLEEGCVRAVSAD